MKGLTSRKMKLRKSMRGLGFFGGGIEEGETPEEGFFREAREELGLDMNEFDYKYIGEQT